MVKERPRLDIVLRTTAEHLFLLVFPSTGLSFGFLLLLLNLRQLSHLCAARVLLSTLFPEQRKNVRNRYHVNAESNSKGVR